MEEANQMSQPDQTSNSQQKNEDRTHPITPTLDIKKKTRACTNNCLDLRPNWESCAKTAITVGHALCLSRALRHLRLSTSKSSIQKVGSARNLETLANRSPSRQGSFASVSGNSAQRSTPRRRSGSFCNDSFGRNTEASTLSSAVFPGSKTFMHFAASRGFVSCIRVLRRMGANQVCFDSEGHAPIHLAAFHGHADAIMELLREKKPVMSRSVSPQSPPTIVPSSPAPLEADEDTNGKCREVDSPTNPDEDSNLDEDETPEQGLTVSPWQAEIANLRTTGSTNRTALHWAAANGHGQVVRTLVEAGASWDLHDARGLNPLHIAADQYHSLTLEALLNEVSHRAKQPHLQVLQMLYSKDGVNDASIFHHAAAAGDARCINTIFSAFSASFESPEANIFFSDIDSMSQSDDDAEIHKRRMQAFLDLLDGKQRTALHYAAERGVPQAVRTIRDLGASLHIRDKDGRTAHDVAEVNNHKECALLLNTWTEREDF